MSNSIYGIPASELSKEPFRVRNGSYYNFKGYNLYVPDEVDASTAAFIYYPGAGGSGNDAKILNNIIESGSANQIIIIADDAYQDKASGGTRHLQLIENIGAENGVDITKIDIMGFSAGGPATYNTLINTIQSYPDSGKHSAVFCDVVDFNVADEHIDLLIDNEATLVYLEPNNTAIVSAKKLARGGVDVVLAWTSGSHAAHVPMNKEALENGFIDFVTGESDLLANSEIYKFVVYDPERDRWREISLEEVSEKFVNAEVAANPFRYYERLSNMETELRCHNSFLGSKIGNIRNAIKNSNFLSTTSMEQYSSTTQIPNAESEVVQKYFSSCAKMLNNLEKDTSKIIDIGNSIADINDNLKKDATNLNTSVNLYSNIGNNNSSNSSNSNNSWTSVSSGSNSYSGSSGYSGNYYSGGSYTGGSNSTGSSSTPVENPTTGTTPQVEDEFLEYNYLCNDAEKKILVFKNTEDNYKVVVHYENDKITGMDYYYQYATRKIAEENMAVLEKEYGTDCQDVLRETNTLKVVMKDSVFSNKTLTSLKEEYSKLDYMVEIKELDK